MNDRRGLFCQINAFFVELNLLPPGLLPPLAQVFYRPPHLFKPDVQRCEAAAQDVEVDRSFQARRSISGAEIANHPAGDQRPHDGTRPGGAGQADQ